MARAGSRRRPGWSTQANEIVNRVFVYGTFRSGEPAGAMLQPHAISNVPATVPGRLVMLPEGYPALLDPRAHAPRGNVVVGELIGLRDLAGALALMDAYEGEDYERVLLQVVTGDGDKHWSWCYQLAAMHKAGDAIPGGDWVRFRRNLDGQRVETDG